MPPAPNHVTGAWLDRVVVRAAAVLGLVWLGDALIYVVLPLHAAAGERSGTTVERLAAFATWVDAGLAVGPLVGGFVVAHAGLRALYQTLAVTPGATLVIHLAARRRAVRA